MSCRGLRVSHICSERRCFFLFPSGRTLNLVSPHILKQRSPPSHGLGSRQGLSVCSSTWNSSQLHSLRSAQRRKVRKKKARNKVCLGVVGLIGMSYPREHLRKIKVSKVTAHTFPRWREFIPYSFLLSLASHVSAA